MKNKKLSIGLILGGLLLLPALGVQLRANSAPVPSGDYGVSLDVQEVPDGGSYVVKAEITDAQTGELVSAPQILTPSGEEASMETVFETGGVEITLRLRVQVSAELLSYRFEALHGETVRALQRGDIHY